MATRLLLILAIFGASPAWCEIYRWTDADGRVHFGDRPQGASAEQVPVREAPPLPAQSPALSGERQQQEHQRLIDALREEREAREQKRRQAEEREARRAQHCAHARNRLQRYRRGRLYQPQEDGGRRYLNDLERQQELARADAEVERWCRP
ncbi:MAG: DUF4124 domain-containing protein [Gammaproteobacteria bacterium]|nr:DUF4124 domain-containing protein [Gammaproteobacteria bacterium]